MDITKLPIMKNNELSILSFKKEMESLNPTFTLNEYVEYKSLHEFSSLEDNVMFAKLVVDYVKTDNIDWSK
ncbi:MAG: hypothetical protein U9N34_10280 [Candidatus Cloacimonadota bacterium]|nr:hypothetical protein [Candidatus Cloacimonadota bacterium]